MRRLISSATVLIAISAGGATGQLDRPRLPATSTFSGTYNVLKLQYGATFIGAATVVLTFDDAGNVHGTPSRTPSAATGGVLQPEAVITGCFNRDHWTLDLWIDDDNGIAFRGRLHHVSGDENNEHKIAFRGGWFDTTPEHFGGLMELERTEVIDPAGQPNVPPLGCRPEA